MSDEPKLLVYRPFTSRDLDLLASIANAYRLASKTHATLQRSRRRTASPVLADLEVKTGAVLRSVQFLKSVRGDRGPTRRVR